MFLYEPKEECLGCLAKENKLDDVEYWLRAVLDQLYGIENFEASTLEYYLDELTLRLGMGLPARNLVIVRNDRTVDIATVLESWKTLNNQYLNNVAQAGA